MRTIDADVLTEEIASLSVSVTGLRAGKGVLNEYMKHFRDSVLRVISEQATVEAAPVVHGRWIDRPAVKGQVYCSECATIEKSTDSNYKSRCCPNCGAKMGGEKDG